MQVRLLYYCLMTPGALPPILWGPPGVAKTAIVGQLAQSAGWHFIHRIFSDVLPEDIGGTPWAHGDRMTRYPADWVREALDVANTGKIVLILTDEMTTAPQNVQAPLMRLYHERKAGDTVLPPDRVKIVGAANPPDMAANGTELAHALSNRATHINWPALPLEVWSEFILSGRSVATDLPSFDAELWERKVPLARAHVTAFLRTRPGLANEDCIKTEGRGVGQFASYRTWDNAMLLLATCYAFEDADAPLPLLAGTIGEPGAVELAAWLRETDLPDPEELLSGKLKFKGDPKRPDRTFAVLVSVAAAATSKQHGAKEYRERWNAAWAVIGDVMDQGKDLVVVAARMLGRARPQGGLLEKPVQKILGQLSGVVREAGLL
jgi:hypothetical protein